MKRTYKIPYLLTLDRSSRNKARVVYVRTDHPDGTFTLAAPADSVLFTVTAGSINEAHRALRAEVRPGDPRNVCGAWAIRFFAVGETVVGRAEQLPDFEDFV